MSRSIFLMMRDAIPTFGLVVAAIAALALTSGVKRRTLGIAWVLLLAPYVVMGLLEQSSGLAHAFRIARWSIISPLAGVALLVATVKHAAPKSDKPETRLEE